MREAAQRAEAAIDETDRQLEHLSRQLEVQQLHDGHPVRRLASGCSRDDPRRAPGPAARHMLPLQAADAIGRVIATFARRHPV